MRKGKEWHGRKEKMDEGREIKGKLKKGKRR